MFRTASWAIPAGLVLLAAAFLPAWAQDDRGVTVAGAVENPADVEPGDRWAILIGVKDYMRLAELEFCDLDVTEVGRLLVEVGNWREDHILVMTDDAEPGKQPTKANILHYLNAFLASVKETDTVWFYFSGHGISAEDGKDYLLPKDCIPGKKEDFLGTAIPVDTVIARLTERKPKTVLMFLDACRRNPEDIGKVSFYTTNISGVGEEASAAAVEAGVILFRSCRSRELSQELRPVQRGAFTYAVLEGLRGAADGYKRRPDDTPVRSERKRDLDNSVTVLELDAFLDDKFPELNLQEGLPPQNPVTRANDISQLGTVIVGKEREPPDEPPQVTVLAPERTGEGKSVQVGWDVQLLEVVGLAADDIGVEGIRINGEAVETAPATPEETRQAGLAGNGVKFSKTVNLVVGENAVSIEARDTRGHRAGLAFVISRPAPPPGTIQINSYPPAEAYLDGEPVGETPLVLKDIAPGQHTVALEHPVYGRHEESFELLPGQTYVVYHEFDEPPSVASWRSDKV